MPTATARKPRPSLLLPNKTAAALAAGAGYAAAELAAALLIGGWFEWGRAEALLFLAFRPWLLLAFAFLLAPWPLRDRIAAYAAALLIAAASETLLVLAFGAADPWAEMLRGLIAGAALLLVLDLLFQAGRRLLGRRGRWAAAALALLLFLTPVGLRGYEAIVLPIAEESPGERPALMLMTGLPIIWGEGGAFDPESRPAAAYRALEREFAVQPLDVLSEETLGGGGLLLLAQPRGLAPAELVALDAWVRRGGRALILTDPLLVWPSDLPLGDIRRAPAVGLLGPLLTHWGLSLHPPVSGGVVERRLEARKLRLAAPGRFRASAPPCAVREQGLLADCRIGSGRALLLADADLLHDDLWAGAGGAARHQRTADNPLVVADLLDGLAGVEREPVDGDVAWAAPDADRTSALLFGLLPILLALGVALILRRKSRA